MAYLDNNGLLYFWQQLKTKLAAKADASDVPTKTSDLTNDSGFITTADIPEGAAASTTTPIMDGTASTGSELAFARGDHVHPTDTSRQATITASGILKGNGSGSVSAAVAGTDYAAASHGTHVTYSTTAPAMDGTASAGTASTVSRSDHVHPSDTSRQAKITASGILKGNGSGGVTAAVAGTDYLTTHQDISGKADIASPTFTGTPSAPTAAAGTSTTQIATTEFVTTALASYSTTAAIPQGDLDAQSTLTNANYKNGWYWVVTTAGTYAGETCEVGDVVWAKADKGSSYSASDFFVVQRNLDLASITNAQIDTILAS